MQRAPAEFGSQRRGHPNKNTPSFQWFLGLAGPPGKANPCRCDGCAAAAAPTTVNKARFYSYDANEPFVWRSVRKNHPRLRPNPPHLARPAIYWHGRANS